MNQITRDTPILFPQQTDLGPGVDERLGLLSANRCSLPQGPGAGLCTPGPGRPGPSWEQDLGAVSTAPEAWGPTLTATALLPQTQEPGPSPSHPGPAEGPGSRSVLRPADMPGAQGEEPAKAGAAEKGADAEEELGGLTAEELQQGQEAALALEDMMALSAQTLVRAEVGELYQQVRPLGRGRFGQVLLVTHRQKGTRPRDGAAAWAQAAEPADPNHALLLSSKLCSREVLCEHVSGPREVPPGGPHRRPAYRSPWGWSGARLCARHLAIWCLSGPCAPPPMPHPSFPRQ